MGIYESQLAEGRILAMMPAHKAKVRKAQSDIVAMLTVCKNPYVALSWGKQSICLMHMVYRINPYITGLFFREPETNIIADFDSVAKLFIEKWNIDYRDVMLSEASHQKAADKWETENKSDGVFLGFSRHESKARRFTLARADANNIYTYTNGYRRCCPLRLWSDMDIAAYAAFHDIPMLFPYRKFGFSVRTSAGIEMGTPEKPDHSEVGFDKLTGQQRYDILESQRKRKQ